MVTSVSPQVGAELEEEDMPDPDEAMLCGRLKNSESECVVHLDLAKKGQLIDLFKKYCFVFGDTPTQTNLMEHVIEVGDAKPIRHGFDRVHPEMDSNSWKRKFTICWTMGLRNPLIPVGHPLVC